MIIGLAGFKRTGKDTFASYFPSNFTRMAFAEPLKQAAAIIYDVPITVPTAHAVTSGPPTTVKTHTPTGTASNIILYGPPGTGKTHSVRRRTLELIGVASLDGKPVAKAADEQVQREWDRLRSGGQIVFCTFHQAFAYEEFVEGLRAITDANGNVRYRVEDGIFKALAKKAATDTGVGEEVDFDTLWSRLAEELDAQPRSAKGKQGGDYILSKSSNGNVVVADAKGGATKAQRSR